jgi:hypothetical protein
LKPRERSVTLAPVVRCLPLLLASCLAAPSLAAVETTEAFPPPLTAYHDEEGAPLGALLAGRVRAEPLNAVASGLFLLAILHTFAAPWITALANRLQREAKAAAAADIPGDDVEPPDPHSFKVETLHFLGEVEAVFGIWAVPVIAAIALAKGWHVAEAFLSRGVNFTEPLFVVVIMALSATRPVLRSAEAAIGLLAGLGRRTPLAWWLAILSVGPILGSFLTEPAAMTISALLLARQLYDLDPSPRLKYATLGLLFVNVSVGGTLTHFAAPPVLMVAGTWGWDMAFMLGHFGWKAVTGMLVSNLLYLAVFRKELRALAARAAAEPAERYRRIPAWVTGAHLAFLTFTVLSAHTPPLFIGGFLFFLAFAQATLPHQSAINLRPPLLVGFFLAGLVIHGTLQQWWIAPVLGRLEPWPMMLGATFLTSFNDNAAITYLASLVPGFTDELKFAVMAGAVTGGGLTVIANAPNPAGQSILGRFFRDGISPAGLALGALLPTIIVGACFMLLPS